MNKNWVIWVFVLSIFLIGTQKSFELRQLSPYFHPEKSLKFAHFERAKKNIQGSDLELLKLWESMLTGRSAPLSKWTKQRYRLLGLNHIFTPSGFHLSAVMLPFLRILKGQRSQLILLLLLGVGMLFVPGQGALKRMVSIKSHQKIFGTGLGFCLALFMDMLMGTFQNSPLSFTYSFLFLGIIYSGARGPGLFFWFFLAQGLLAYFQSQSISALLIFVAPFLNFSFSIAMPLLFLLAFPLWSWQLKSGLLIMKTLQFFVDVSAHLVQCFPLLDMNVGLLAIACLFTIKRWKSTAFLVMFLSFHLNEGRPEKLSLSRYEYVPNGRLIRAVAKNEKDVLYFSDGKCERKQWYGLTQKRCSPKKRAPSI